MNKNIRKILGVGLITALAVSLSGCDDFTIAMNQNELAFLTNEEGDPYTFIKYDDAFAVIDVEMDNEYILASLAAIAEFNRIPTINIRFIIDHPENHEYDIAFYQYHDEIVDYCSEDDSGVVACNSASADGEYILSANIRFNVNVMEDLDQAWFNNVAIHELGHTFGLKDLYEDVFEEMSIMYYQASDVILEGLTEWDLSNLNYVYGG